MILSVKGLDEELNAFRLYTGFMLEGKRFGYNPTMQNNVESPIVAAEADHAVHHAARAM
jgi:hypothetical protein